MSAFVPRFVYRNLADDMDIAASDEVATLPDDNLQITQPSKAWRADTLASLVVLASYADNRAFEFDTAWLGYANFTPKRNLLKNSHAMGSAGWTTDSLATVSADLSVTVAPSKAGSWNLTANGSGSITHGITQTWTPTLTVGTNEEYVTAVYVNASEPTTAAEGFELAMLTNLGAAVSVQFDFGTETFGSVTLGSGWSAGVASQEAVTIGGVSSYRLKLTATQSSAITALSARGRLVMSGSTSFEQSGEQIKAGEWFMDFGSTAYVEPSTTTENAAGLSLEAPNGTSLQTYFPAVTRSLANEAADMGYVHGAAHIGATTTTALNVEWQISDENNLDTYVDVGRLVIGNSFKPTGALVQPANATHKGNMPALRRTWEAGRWVYEIEFDYVEADTAEREFMDMYRHANKNDDGRDSVRTAGGQRFSRRKGVLFIADTGAGSSEPERTVYGELLGQVPLVSTVAGKYRITVRIGEFPA